MTARPRPTQPIGLYDPANEHDACGVAFVAKLQGDASHETIERAVQALENLEHRGAAGADPNTGDGAGLLTQMPDELFRDEIPNLPPLGAYGVGVCFLPRGDAARAAELQRLVETTIEAEGQTVLGWRDVPVDERHVGETAGAFAPTIKQVVVGAAADEDLLHHRLFFAHGGRHRHVAVDRHVAPAEQHLAFGLDGALEFLDAGQAGGVLLGQEDHADAVLARGRQGDTLRGHFLAVELVGDLQQDARPVAHQRIGTDRTAVVEVLEDLQTLLDDAVRLLALDVRHEADTAGVVLVVGV
jgi:hypothetical protein